jgi:RNA polymerase sigma factor (TIGR02999 family)
VARRSPGEVTTLLRAWQGGDKAALDRLVPLVYGELRRISHRRLARERGDHSLQTTALINEAYIRLADVEGLEWQDRAHFFAIAANLMRRVLVDRARSRAYLKRGGGAQMVSLDEALAVSPRPGLDLVKLDDALKALSEFDPRKARVVELRFFGGLSGHEAAAVLGISRETVKRDWRVAKMWLLCEMTDVRERA